MDGGGGGGGGDEVAGAGALPPPPPPKFHSAVTTPASGPPAKKLNRPEVQSRPFGGQPGHCRARNETRSKLNRMAEEVHLVINSGASSLAFIRDGDLRSTHRLTELLKRGQNFA